jgi:cytochrome d ubiquinol oxidase subunit II
MSLQILWFILWGVLWAAYFMLDGFDLGAGMLYGFLGRSPAERTAIRRTLGPVWDGNEVWLITAGGATFAAFPAVYASMFSFFYWPLLLVLFALMFRGLGLEFRYKSGGAAWAKAWDASIMIASFALALLFGVAFGNIFRGLPIDGAGYHGTFMSLLNPYGLLTGLLFVLMFCVHGSLWVALKTDGDLSRRALKTAGSLWLALAATAAAFLAVSYFATNLAANYLRYPVWLIVPVLAVLCLGAVKLWARRGKIGRAFSASSAAIVFITFTGIVGLFPNLIPSRLDPASSLTLANSSSTPYTLKIMTVVALVFVPIVIAYQIWIHRVFRHKTPVEDQTDSYDY